MDTLVLNKAYMPVDRVTWMAAIRDVVIGRAEVVEAYEDRVIRSASDVFPMPSVIRFLRRAVFYRRGVAFNRQNVWLRDHGTCQYCGQRVSRREFTYDHVRPRQRGGKASWTNIVVCCFACNQRKANRTPREAGMRLTRAPFQPRNLPGRISAALVWSEGMPPSWRDYLHTVRYWYTRLD